MHKGGTGIWCLTEQITLFLFSNIKYFKKFGLAANCANHPQSTHPLPGRRGAHPLPAPQNVARGFTALRSSEDDSQHNKSL